MLTLKPSKKIKIDALGNLKIEDTEANQSALQLAIRPLLGSIRPGDDVLLKVLVNGVTLTTEAKDYLAVYDKKMLWRANSYIDAQDNPQTPDVVETDWNNVYPWNAPINSNSELADYPIWGKNTDGTEWIWGYNDWNNIEPDSERISGSQVTSIRSWTRWSNNLAVTTTVAYGWGCMDTPFTFNTELVAQNAYIQDGRSQGGNIYLGVAFAGLAWDNGATTAPGNSWQNYIAPKRKIEDAVYKGVAYQFYKYNQNQNLADNLLAPIQHLYSIKGSTKSIPGFSTFLAFSNVNNAILSANSPNDGNYDGNQTNFTSGIDCSGLATIVTQYNGSVYYLGNKDKHNTTGLQGDLIAFLFHPGRVYDANGNVVSPGWKLTVPDNPANPNSPEILQRNLDRNTISHAVPGDFLIKTGHVVIIQDLQYAEGSDVITNYMQVAIIHATRGVGPDTWQVQINTWADLGDESPTLAPSYQLRRYK